MKELIIDQPFELECGKQLPKLEITYHTFGQLNEKKDNVVWVFHALTGNSNPVEWWPGLVGTGKLLDPDRFFIVCANMLGSCYGSIGPASINPANGKKWEKDFPLITIKDMVNAHKLLKAHLEIDTIKLGIGGSMGGQQAVQWAVDEPEIFENLVLLATNAKHSPWGIAFNEAQRMAIKADPSFDKGGKDAGKAGLEAARAIAMLSYRSYYTYQLTQSESSEDKLDDFMASSYQRYQGMKLQKRFDVYSYWTLSKAMDNHNVARGRNSFEEALGRITANTLVLGIKSDILFPIDEQAFLANHIKDAKLEILDSIYGHDGFLVEAVAIENAVKALIENNVYNASQTAYRLLNGRNCKSRKN